MLETSKITINDKSLRIHQSGEGEAVIFLHGYPDNLQVWSKLVPLISNSYHSIAFDWPGMGYSEEWKGGTAPSQQAKKIIAIMDYLGIEKTHLVAHDMGGQAAMVAAAQYPDRIHSVIVMNSLLMWNATTSWEIKYLRRLGMNRFLLNYFPGIVFNRAIRTFGSGKKKIPGEVLKDLWESFRQRKVRKFIIRLCAGYEAQLPRLIGYYEKLHIPALLLWADRGKHFSTEHAYAVAKLNPGVQVEVLANTEHWMAYENPEVIGEKILHFLARISAV